MGASRNVTNTTSSTVTNTLSTNVTSTVSIKSDDKKAKYKTYSYIFAVLLVIILLFIITIIWCSYTKHGSKLKNISPC